MRLGLIGWGIASGNGGMNTDIACLGDFVTKWLIPKHPILPLHDPYIERAKSSVDITFVDENDDLNAVVNHFSRDIDGLLYVEHPTVDIHPYKFDIVDEFHARNKKVFAIPMWEWWPEEESWAINTDGIWAVTNYTNKYMHSLANILETRGILPRWKDLISGRKWGVNVNDFSYRQRDYAKEIVFVRGNAGYKDRKAGELIVPTLKQFASESGLNVTIYSQAQIEKTLNDVNNNVQIIEKVFPDRKSVYERGDIFIFCSYWEGLCHGIYEASYSGGLVLTTNTGPMNECIPAFLVDVENTKNEILGKTIKKSIPSMESMKEILGSLQGKNISSLSSEAHQWILQERNLTQTLSEMYSHFSQCY